MHESAPAGMKCADCAIDGEKCDDCRAATAPPCWQCGKTATHEFHYAETGDDEWRPFCGDRRCGPVMMWGPSYGTVIRPLKPEPMPARR